MWGCSVESEERSGLVEGFLDLVAETKTGFVSACGENPPFLRRRGAGCEAGTGIEDGTPVGEG